jgi:hypothetical protein
VYKIFRDRSTHINMSNNTTSEVGKKRRFVDEDNTDRRRISYKKKKIYGNESFDKVLNELVYRPNQIEKKFAYITDKEKLMISNLDVAYIDTIISSK